jgi:hypothetical protein
MSTSTSNQSELKDVQFNIDQFRRSFYKSDEAIQAFKEVGITYTNAMWDNDYERFQQRSRKTPEKERIKSIGNLKRLVIPTRDKEETYIVYDMHEEAKDALGNRLTAYRSGLGCYHSPIVRREIRLDMETGEKVPVVVGIDQLETKYSIPFTKENIAKHIEKYVTESTTFIIQKGTSGRRLIVNGGFEDWKNVSTEYLLRFGHAPSDYEKQVYADELQGKYEHYKPPISPGAHIG